MAVDGGSVISLTDALNSPASCQWKDAIEKEYTSLLRNKTWTIEERPSNCRILGSKMLLRNKFKANGALDKRKARLVAQGFSQRPGIDYYETFSPVIRLSSLRTIVALAAERGMTIHQMDVETAYLNGELR